jgi:hypothetical protein
MVVLRSTTLCVAVSSLTRSWRLTVISIAAPCAAGFSTSVSASRSSTDRRNIVRAAKLSGFDLPKLGLRGLQWHDASISGDWKINCCRCLPRDAGAGVLRGDLGAGKDRPVCAVAGGAAGVVYDELWARYQQDPAAFVAGWRMLAQEMRRDSFSMRGSG